MAGSGRGPGIRGDKRRWVERSRDQQRSSPERDAACGRRLWARREEPPGFRSEERAAQARRAAPSLRALRFPVKQDPRIIARSSGQSGAHLSFLLDNGKGAADPTPLVEALHQRMHGGRVAQRALAQAGEQVRLIVPGGEVKRRVDALLDIANGLSSRATASVAPALRHAGRSDALAMAVTRAPHSERVCKANVPKPPAAPWTNFLSLGVLTGDAGPRRSQPHRDEAIGQGGEVLKLLGSPAPSACGRPLRAHGRRAFRLSKEASLRRRALR